ncbi:MAG: hypothetical protein M3R17_20385, partial [Bacteroidota bacterium]|nr:hypothetical protein [Bacteroidota bacterium]
MKTTVDKTAQQEGKAIANDLSENRLAKLVASHPARINGNAVSKSQHKTTAVSSELPIQRAVYPSMAAMWAVVEPSQTEMQIKAITNADTALANAYADVEADLASMNFVYVNGTQPAADIDPLYGGGLVYGIDYGLRGEQNATYQDVTRYIGAILHEMMHITAALHYTTNVPAGNGAVGHVANAHLPAPTAVAGGNGYGVAPNQNTDPVLGIQAQVQTMQDNWEDLRSEAIRERGNGALTHAQADVLVAIGGRIDYAETGTGAIAHYETVLFDVLFYMRSQGLQATRTYQYAHRMMTEANTRRNAGAGAVARIARAQLPFAERADCFLTTACVDYMGFADGCEELTVLRKFRDEYLPQQPNGEKLIELYYEYAPSIVAAIRRREDEDEILKRLYAIIRQCVDAVKNGDHAFAYRTYCRMMIELKNEFIP